MKKKTAIIVGVSIIAVAIIGTVLYKKYGKK
jgi:nitrogen fixation-related uncharacterized protein